MAGAFLARRRRWAWLALPALLAVLVLRGTGDVLAATAGFTALGLTMLGIARLRRVWALVLPVPAVVLLVLLLAPDAFLAIGLGFVALAVAALVRQSLSSEGRPLLRATPPPPPRPVPS